MLLSGPHNLHYVLPDKRVPSVPHKVVVVATGARPSRLLHIRDSPLHGETVVGGE